MRAIFKILSFVLAACLALTILLLPGIIADINEVVAIFYLSISYWGLLIFFVFYPMFVAINKFFK
jgi:hypothetical protein